MAGEFSFTPMDTTQILSNPLIFCLKIRSLCSVLGASCLGGVCSVMGENLNLLKFSYPKLRGMGFRKRFFY